MAYRIKQYNYNDKLTKGQNLLLDRLYRLRMSGMAESLNATHVIDLLAGGDWINEPDNLLMTGGAGA